MELIKPSKQYEQSWRQALQEFKDSADSIGIWNVSGDPSDLDNYIRIVENNSKGIDLPSAWVPFTVYWLVDKNDFVGIVSIRHCLNEYLFKFGGHIGYEIVPSKKGKGIGSQMLKLALVKAKEIGLQEVLITADTDNAASCKLIEKNGGRLENTVYEKERGRNVNRYIVLM